MRFPRYSPSIAVGAAGFLSGVLYNNFPLLRQNVVPTEASLLDIGENDGASRTDSAIEKHGLPSYGNLKSYGEFVLSYNRQRKNPEWVMEHLTPDKLVSKDGTASMRKWSTYYEDESHNKLHRAYLQDYKYSGYDRGHLAAAKNYKYSQESFNKTYVLSNITPQNSHFNQKTWHELEQRVETLAKSCENLYVCSGPIYEPREFNSEEAEKIHQLKGKDKWDKIRESTDEKKKKSSKNKENEISKKMKDESSKEKFLIHKVIGENNVAVPTHFFKVILSEDAGGSYDMESYVIPNERLKKTPLLDYLVPVNEIERSSGLTLFDKVNPSDLRTINGEDCSENKKETEPDIRAA